MEKWKMIVLSAVVLIVIAIIVTKFTRPGSEYEMPRQGEYTVVEIGADLCIPCQLMQPGYGEAERGYWRQSHDSHLLYQ